MSQELKHRFIFSGAAVVIISLVICFSHLAVFKYVFAGIISLVVGVGLWEYFQISQDCGLQPNKKLGIGIAVCFVWSMFLATQYDALEGLPWVVFIVAGFFSFFSKSLANAAVMIFGFVYIVLSLSLMIFIRYFSVDPTIGLWWLVYLLVVTKFTDIGALLVGRLIGKHKLMVKISPKKTVEGFLGGVVFALLGSLMMVCFGNTMDIEEYYILSFGQAVILSMFLSFLGQWGDLAESLLKRSAGVKDSNTLPGLGGILDMVDSLLFTTPVVYIVMRIKFL